MTREGLTESERRRKIAYVRGADGSTEGPLDFFSAQRRAREMLVEHLRATKGVTHKTAATIVYRLAEGIMHVELARYVVNDRGKIKRRFPDKSINLSLATPEQHTQSGRQLLLGRA